MKKIFFIRKKTAVLRENFSVQPKRLGFFVFIFSLSLFCMTGCDRLYRMLQKEGAEEKDLVGEIVPFESNLKVQEIQKLLKLYGYKIGAVDGVLGVNTRNAIEAFQKDNNLPQTRFVDKGTWEQLNMFNETGLVKSGELNLMAVQKALKAAGEDTGKPDGRAGHRTQSAIKSFQKSAGLKADGKIGLKTLKALAEYVPEKEVVPDAAKP